MRGDPGTGKSEMAYAIAAHLKWPLVKKVIQGNTELDDLHFHYDAVKRLADAQVYGQLIREERKKKLDVVNYISPGPIWWAFNWNDAVDPKDEIKKQGKPERSFVEPPRPDEEDWQPGQGCVLLIDEIDKADPDLPNGLLETFGNRRFEVALLQREVLAAQPVLTIITTNEERELPKPFLRRCLVIELELDTNEETRLEWMAERGRLHFEKQTTRDVRLEAARMVWEQREETAENQYQPGLAEYLDLLAALCHVTPARQANILKKIAGFALKKG